MTWPRAVHSGARSLVLVRAWAGTKAPSIFDADVALGEEGHAEAGVAVDLPQRLVAARRDRKSRGWSAGEEHAAKEPDLDPSGARAPSA